MVAPPAHITPKSASIHSVRVPARIATRSWGRRPRSSRPAAISVTAVPVTAQVCECQSPALSGCRYASAAGVRATRSSNIAPKDAGSARRSSARSASSAAPARQLSDGVTVLVGMGIPLGRPHHHPPGTATAMAIMPGAPGQTLTPGPGRPMG